MTFSEKLIYLRRRKGLSQEQLADKLDVTRQSVSKWESGSAMPEIVKLISLSKMFEVSIDYLLKDDLDEPEKERLATKTVRLEQKLDVLAGEYHRSFGPYYSYTSEVRVCGVPLLSIRFGRERHPTKRTTAVGIIAIGNFSVGVVSIGLISAGLVSVGMVSLGGFALGVVAIGGMALGMSALGFSAQGAAAVNFLK